jgi:hypothetical protein
MAALVFALLGAAVAKRTGVKGVPAKKKPNTEPPGRGGRSKDLVNVNPAIERVKDALS